MATSAQKSDALLDCSFVAGVAKKSPQRKKPTKKKPPAVTGG